MLRLTKIRTAMALGSIQASTTGSGTVWSYMRTVRSEIGKQERDVFPIAFELNRRKQICAELIPEIQANRKVAAQLDVEIEFDDGKLRQTKDLAIATEKRIRTLHKLVDGLTFR